MRQIPRLQYGHFQGSPLVVNNLVIVPVAGTLAAYELISGKMRWSIFAGGDCYSSPHLATIDGVTQVLFLNDDGLQSIAPEDGQLLWKHSWKGNPILQPAFTPDGDIIISNSAFSGLRRLKVSNGSNGWSVKEQWTSTKFKPNHNDFVVHKGSCLWYGYGGNCMCRY